MRMILINMWTMPQSKIDSSISEVTPPSRGSQAVAHTSGEMRRVFSSDLLPPGGELQIEHAGALYRLRATRNGKLILTK
jgi:hemin uptake protein HemP